MFLFAQIFNHIFISMYNYYVTSLFFYEFHIFTNYVQTFEIEISILFTGLFRNIFHSYNKLSIPFTFYFITFFTRTINYQFFSQDYFITFFTPTISCQFLSQVYFITFFTPTISCQFLSHFIS
jgi:hypothetical protein